MFVELAGLPFDFANVPLTQADVLDLLGQLELQRVPLAENRAEDKLKVCTVPGLLIIDEIGHLPIDRTGATSSSSSSHDATGRGR